MSLKTSNLGPLTQYNVLENNFFCSKNKATSMTASKQENNKGDGGKYMERLDPQKLYVEFRSGVTTTEPILGRKYTLTHSDITAELFLTIGLQFAYDKITSMRDEVLGEWRNSNSGLFLYIYVYIGDFGSIMNSIRNTIFRRELPLALEAIVYGDNEFFVAHPQLNYAPIWIYFDSIDPSYKRFEYFGVPIDYK